MAKNKNSNLELHSDKNNLLASIPLWFKANFFRWWIVGMAYFFFGFSSSEKAGSYSQIISLGIIIGLLNSFFISYVIDQMSHVEYHKNPHVSIRKKGAIGLFFNIVLSILILVVIGFTYDGINRFLIYAFSLDEYKIYFPAEPVGFALMYLVYDFLWRFMACRKKKKALN